MSTLSKARSQDTIVMKQIKNKFLPYILFLCIFALSACPKRPPKYETEGPYRRPPVVEPEEEMSPEVQAAQQLLQQGQEALKEDDPETAEWHFQEAVRIASSYGPAYYWLARAKFDLGELPQAWDLLDRAELLIGHDPEWLERIDQLKAAISDEKL